MDPQEKWVMLIDKPSRKMGMWWDMHRAIPQDGNTAAKLHIKCCQSDHQKRSSGSCQESQTWHRCACTVSFFSSLFKSFQVDSDLFSGDWIYLKTNYIRLLNFWKLSIYIYHLILDEGPIN
jgi:hypothetical protein